MESVAKLIKKLEESGTGFEKLELFRQKEKETGSVCQPAHLVEVCDKYGWAGTKEKVLKFTQELLGERAEPVAKKEKTSRDKEELSNQEKKDLAKAALEIMAAKKEV